MRWDTIPMYIAGTGTSRPKEVTVETAIASGHYDRAEAEKGQLLAATVADPEQPAVEFAVNAARQALTRANLPVADLEILLYAVVLDPGIPVWNSAAYIQRELGADHCPADEIRSACAGALRAVDLACSTLTAHRGRPAALVVAADCWPPSMIDRWRSGTPIVWGDGGSALILSGEAGFARVLALNTYCDSALEEIHRAAEPFNAPHYPIHFRPRIDHFFEHTMSKSEYARRCDFALRAVVEQATTDARVPLADIKHVLYGFLPYDLMDEQCLRPLGITVGRTTWAFGRRIGHMGAGDVIAGYDYIVQSGQLAPGDCALAIAVGAGYVWSAAVIQTLE